jgi:hypothetical protein
MKQTKIRRLGLNAIAVAFLAAGLAAPVTAELARVGPTVPTHGFPAWYQDSTGLALALCLPKDAIDLANANCLLATADVPGGAPETPFTNFADEHFWYAAGSLLDTGNGGGAVLTLAVEAAFNLEVRDGDQVSFGRIRVRIDNLPSNGTYRVIHPYGELVFPDQVAGSRIFYTDDVGIACAAGDFSCALKTGLGPYLRPADVPGGPAHPFVTINGSTMIADPVAETFVTGGPYSNKFRIEGPDIGGPGIDFVETEIFTIMGRVFTDPIPSPMKVERAGYTRDANGTWIDVFAHATPGIGRPLPTLAVSGAGVVPKVMSPGSNGAFWGQTNATAATAPSQVLLTNSADVPPTTIEVAVHDLITVTEALYDPVAKTLSVKARTSDTGPDAPSLFLPEFGGLGTNDTTGAVVSDLAVPPKSVVVQSSRGGSSAAPVTTRQAAAIVLNLPDLSASGDEDQIIGINLAPVGGYTAGSFRILSQGANGVVNVDADGNATYMPAANFEGADSFTYMVADSNGNDSNVATVAITVNGINDLPVANPDSGATTMGVPLAINLLANDVDPDPTTGIDPASVQITVPPAAGSVSLNNGVATYTPAATGNYSFTYQVADLAGATATAQVTVQVQGIENIAVTGAEYRADKGRWKVSGTTSIDVDQTITIRPRNSTTGAVGGVIGTAVVGAAGAWSLDTTGSSVTATGFNQVEATSPLGGRGVGALRVR